MSDRKAALPDVPDGLVGVFLTLAREHREASALLDQVRANPAMRPALWPLVKATLVPHEKGEVREVFPVLRQVPDTRGEANHHDEEARGLEQMIYQLDLMDLASEAWSALFEQLAATVVAHATEEEQRIFPDAQRVLGEAKAMELDLTYLTAKAQVLGGLTAAPVGPTVSPTETLGA